MKIFLHLGYVKTGSTAIQTSFAHNKNYIEAHDACLPIPPRLLNNQIKGRVSSGNGRFLKEAIYSGSFDSVVDLIKQDIVAHEGCKNYIYSSEILFYALADLHRFRILKKALNILGFSELKILLFVRGLASHAISWHGEMTKTGLTTSTITEYMNEYDHPTGVVRLIKFVDEINDGDLRVCLELRNYSCLNNKVVEVAWNWLGIPAPIETLSLNNPINRSLTESEAEFCRQLAKAGCKPEFIARSLSMRLPNIKPIYPRPTLESLNNMYCKHLKNLEFLNKLLPANEQLFLSAADENIETNSYPINNFSFSSEQLILIAQEIAPLMKKSHPLPN